MTLILKFLNFEYVEIISYVHNNTTTLINNFFENTLHVCA